MSEYSNVYATLSDEQREKLELFGKILLEENAKTNLTRIVEPEMIRVKHFEDSLAGLAVMDKIAEGNGSDYLEVADVGSGAGFPGLVLAIVRPNFRLTSIEATGKKARFQLRVVDELGLGNVHVVQERAEEMGKDDEYREWFDVVTARAVGQLALISELSIPLLRMGGTFLAWKGPSVVGELGVGLGAIDHLGGRLEGEISYHLEGQQVDGEDVEYRILKAVKKRHTPRSCPREYKFIKLKPLGS